jgi:trans-aconitate methyltransferase
MNTHDSVPNAGQKWNAGDYAKHGRFVADLGASLLDWLKPVTGERILDLGCGDGALTAQIAERGAAVVGVDASPELVAAAQARGIDARVGDGQSLKFAADFDAVFSNAALHWMKRDPDAVLAGIWRALKPGGRFVAEMGGAGNVASIRGALHGALETRGVDADAADPWYFPTTADYQARLEAAGFEVQAIERYDRPTSLPGDVTGWLSTFAQSFLKSVPATAREEVLSQVRAALHDRLTDAAGKWTADYVRLRFIAVKPFSF